MNPWTFWACWYQAWLAQMTAVWPKRLHVEARGNVLYSNAWRKTA